MPTDTQTKEAVRYNSKNRSHEHETTRFDLFGLLSYNTSRKRILDTSMESTLLINLDFNPPLSVCRSCESRRIQHEAHKVSYKISSFDHRYFHRHSVNHWPHMFYNFCRTL